MNVFKVVRTVLRCLAREACDERGVALLVLAIGLVVAAGSMIATKVLMNETTSRERSQGGRANFGKIERALIAWAVDDVDHRLPCPANPGSGTLGSTVGYSGTSCVGSQLRGIVPFRELGLSADEVRDGYGNFITYVVSTETLMCNGTVPATGTVIDQAGGSSFLFALISHGENGAGAWTGETAGREVNAANMSTAERINCPSGTGQTGCTVAVNNQDVNDTTQSTTIGANYFDDAVFFPNAADEAYVDNCASFTDPNTPNGAAFSFATPNDRNLTLSADSATADEPEFDSLDVDGSGTEESVVVRFYDRVDVGQTGGERSCLTTEQTFPLDGYTIRVYSDVYFQEDFDDTGTPSPNLGNGIVYGWAGFQTSTGSPTLVVASGANTTCGGRDAFMGFAEEDTNNRFPTNWERFGVEFDTKNNRPTTPATTDIIDPGDDPATSEGDNHFAVVLGDVHHFDDITEGAAESGVTGGDNGPVCATDSDLTSYGLTAGDGDGTAPADRSPTFNRTVTGTYPSTDNTDDQACFLTGTDPTWLEDGDPFADSFSPGVNERFQRIRYELHGEMGNGCDANQVRLDGWIYRFDDVTPSNPTVALDDLTGDYDGELPHITQCIVKSGQIDAVRLILTTGIPEVDSGAVTLKRTGVGFSRVDDLGGPVANDFVGTLITEEGIRNGLYTGMVPTGDLNDDDFDQSFAIVEATDNTQSEARAYAGFGIFSLDENNGVGVDGVGADAETIDNIQPNEAAFAGLPTFLSPGKRENLTIEFDDKVTQVMINLRDFADQEFPVGTTDFTTDDDDPQMERVRLRAYDTTITSGSQQVGSDQIVESCYENHHLNSGNANTGIDFGTVVSTNFGGAFNKLEIIPEPILSPSADDYLDSYTQFVVSAVRGCGSAETCGFDAFDLPINGSDAESHSRCANLTFPTPATTGTGSENELNPSTFRTAINDSGGGNDNNLDRAWFDLSDSAITTDLGVDLYTSSGRLGVTDGSNGGFGINSQSGQSSDFVDTVSTPDNNAFGTDRETISVRFERRWNTVAVGLSRFGTDSGDEERASIRIYSGGNLIGTYATPAFTTLGANCDLGASANSRFEVTIESVSNLIDRIEVTAMPNEAGGQSAFMLRGVQACALGTSPCAVDYEGDPDLIAGNPDDDDNDNFCHDTLTIP
ncbi:MAG: hypothetical protein SFV21_04320 [Rhodospirillaceae bacterium]|nr:hypothetical protein [Rhodospirillaceae bacterium]